jgi:hypothetical protein
MRAEEQEEGELERLDPRLRLREVVALVQVLVPHEGGGGFVAPCEIIR